MCVGYYAVPLTSVTNF